MLAGKYRVEKILGVGGMGVVVAARHAQLRQRVAIKFLLPHSLGNAEVVGRFLREARAAALISSEHVARVLDVGNLDGGAPYMVIEYLEGRDLGSWLAQKGVLPVDQAVEFVLQAIEAIAEAHSLGIVHRDLKPANLYCVRRADGALLIKVLDFGISKLQHRDSTASDMDLTRTTTVIGSPFYMSPEQLRSSRNVDARTDIWSLGVILYQLVSGKPPFTATGLPELVIKITNEPAPPLRSTRSEIPVGLEQVILRCLQKDRTERYETVADLAVALAPFGPPSTARASAERTVRILNSDDDSRATLTPQLGTGGSIPIEAAWGHTASPTLAAQRWVRWGLIGMLGAAGAVALGWHPLHRSSDAVPAASRGDAPPVRGSVSAVDSTTILAKDERVPLLAAKSSSSAETGVDMPTQVGRVTAPSSSLAAPVDKSPKAPLQVVSGPKKPAKPVSLLESARLTSTEPSSTADAGDSTCKRGYTLDKDGNAQFKPSCI